MYIKAVVFYNHMAILNKNLLLSQSSERMLSGQIIFFNNLSSKLENTLLN